MTRWVLNTSLVTHSRQAEPCTQMVKRKEIKFNVLCYSDGPIGLKIAKAHTKAMTQRKPVPQDCREWEILDVSR